MLYAAAAFLHVSFQHLLANLLLFAVLGGMLECRYGTLRMLVVAVLSTMGAAFFAGAFADQCTQVGSHAHPSYPICSRRTKR